MPFASHRHFLIALTIVVGSTNDLQAQFTTIINIPPDVPPSIIGSDTQLNLADGGSLGTNFAVGNGRGTSSNVELNITGGAVASGLDAHSGSTVNLSGGFIGDDFGSDIRFANFDVFPGSIVNMSDGMIGSGMQIYSEVNVSGGIIQAGTTVYGSGTLNVSGGTVQGLREAAITDAALAVAGGTLNVSGGTIGDFTIVNTGGSVVNITGGSVGEHFRASNEANQILTAVVNISGGDIGEGFMAAGGSQVNLVGSEFLLDGVPVQGLSTGQSTVVADRNVTLSGKLADGTPFDFDLNPTDLCPNRLFSNCKEDQFSLGAELTLRLAGSSADFDADSDVDGDDLSQWMSDFGIDGGSDADADGDSDGMDFLAWQRGFGGSPSVASYQSVPELGTAGLLSVAFLLTAVSRTFR